MSIFKNQEQDRELPRNQSTNLNTPDNFFAEMSRWGLAILSGILSFGTMMLVASLVRLPWSKAPEGIVSWSTRNEFEPITDYVKFIIIFVGTFIAFAVTYWQSRSVIKIGISFIKIVVPPVKIGARLLLSNITVRQLLLWLLVFGLAIVALINLTAADLFGPLKDTFHEGEYLGFLPAALDKGNLFENTFLIHGFGKNVLPTLLADHLATNDNRIGLTRLINLLFTILAYIMAWLSMTIAAGLRYPHQRPWLRIFCITSLIFIGLQSIINFWIDVRDTVFMLQLALIMVFFLVAYSQQRWLPTVAAVLVGVSLPLAFLWTYDRAVYMVMVTVLVTIPLLMLKRKIWQPWIIGNITGIVVGIFSLVALGGFIGVENILEQVSYWSKYGRYIWALPLSSVFFEINVFKTLTLSVLVQCSAVILIWNDYRHLGILRTTLSQNLGIITLLVTALVFQRIALDRSDLGHFLSAAMPSVLLMVSLVTPFIEKHLIGFKRIFSLEIKFLGNFVILMLVSALFVIELSKPLNPFKAVSIIQNYRNNYSTPDSRIVKSDYQKAVAILKEEVQASSCFFTMTSEGAWYYLFNKPSCSRFHHLVYARSLAAQEELLGSLEKTKPQIVLFSNEFWSSNIDGVSIFNSNALVARYIMKHYQPYQLIESHWFWHHTDSPWRLMTELVGTFDTTIPQEGTSREDIVLSGTLKLIPSNPEQAAVFVSLGQSNELIAVKRGVSQDQGQWRWSVAVPTAALPKGENQVRFWFMSEPNGILYPLSELEQITIQ